jgi:serine/threonine protein kinase
MDAAGPLPPVPGYEILSVIDRGGMGVVYKARQVSVNRLVALKMVRSGEHAGARELTRFQLEAMAVARLEHPNIVRIYDFGQHEDLPYFSMEFVDGGCLAEKVAGGPLAPRDAAALLATLARAMYVVHEHDIVHRDLKPANILLTAEGIPKIADFGLAKRLDGDLKLTQTKMVMGTASYMAPEQAAGKTKEVGAAADIYALGAIFYEMLTGKPPFRADTRELTIFQVLTDEPVPPTHHCSDIPRDLEAICLKCLEKEIKQRYPDVRSLAADLDRFLAGEPISIGAVSESERHARWARRAGYEILSCVGNDRTGIVYKARQLSLNRLVALKLIALKAQIGSEEAARIRSDAEAIARLHHPHIAQIYDLGELHGQPYFVMEFVEGGSLREKCGEQPVPARQAAELVETLARTMQYAHQHGVVHGRLEPGSILLTADGSPKITEFGLATLPGLAAKDDKEFSQSIAYLAPEHLAKADNLVCPAIDIYGLGAVLYRLLTGQPPFLGKTPSDTREQVLSQEPEPPSRIQDAVPRELDTLCLKCLHKDPSHRYGTAEALAKDLQRFLAGEHLRESGGMTRSGRIAVPGYAISGELGRGALGVVYKAFQASAKRMVALKMILAGAVTTREELARWRQVLDTTAALAHPQVVPIYEIGEQNRCPYFAMEFFPEGSLAQETKEKRLLVCKAVHVIESLARAVHAVHERGVVHGNLKPSNIFLTADGLPRIADFGLPLPVPEIDTSHLRGGPPSSFQYRAVEQLTGAREIGPSADVYALGAILYELLTGQTPFSAKRPQEFVQQIQSAPPPVPSHRQPDVQPALDNLCLRCLERNPRDRPATAEILANELRDVLAAKGMAGRLRGLFGRWFGGKGGVATL